MCPLVGCITYSFLFWNFSMSYFSLLFLLSRSRVHMCIGRYSHILLIDSQHSYLSNLCEQLCIMTGLWYMVANECVFKALMNTTTGTQHELYSTDTAKESCTWFALCCVLLWFGTRQIYPWLWELLHRDDSNSPHLSDVTSFLNSNSMEI